MRMPLRLAMDYPRISAWKLRQPRAWKLARTIGIHAVNAIPEVRSARGRRGRWGMFTAAVQPGRMGCNRSCAAAVTTSGRDCRTGPAMPYRQGDRCRTKHRALHGADAHGGMQVQACSEGTHQHRLPNLLGISAYMRPRTISLGPQRLKVNLHEC